jgi:hypothetical protein
MEVMYLLIGLIAGILAGFWLRHQFDFIKVREDAVFNRLRKKKQELDDEPKEKTVSTKRKDRFTRHITQQ